METNPGIVLPREYDMVLGMGGSQAYRTLHAFALLPLAANVLPYTELTSNKSHAVRQIRLYFVSPVLTFVPVSFFPQ